MPIEMEKSYGPGSEDLILAFEGGLGVKLPKDYHPGGNIINLSIRPEDFGKVYFSISKRDILIIKLQRSFIMSSAIRKYSLRALVGFFLIGSVVMLLLAIAIGVQVSPSSTSAENPTDTAQDQSTLTSEQEDENLPPPVVCGSCLTAAAKSATEAVKTSTAAFADVIINQLIALCENPDSIETSVDPQVDKLLVLWANGAKSVFFQGETRRVDAEEVTAINFIACVKLVEIAVETCNYMPGNNRIERVRSDIEVYVVDSETSATVAQTHIAGSNPDECPITYNFSGRFGSPQNATVHFKGDPPASEDVENWLGTLE